MKNKLMIGFWRCMLNVPPFLGAKQILKEKKRLETQLGFMTEEHRLVHHFVVRELPYAGKPLSPDFVAHELGLANDRVKVILGDLEKHMTFLFRNRQGEVVWAYPVTVDKTPHHLTFSSGEELYAAWAADAFAAPFVQGQLRKEYLSVLVKTECAHCSRPIELSIDSDLRFTVREQSCEPVVFVPDVDPFKVKDESIINAFWNESVFFWSEEHAREDRRRGKRMRGAYFTAKQMSKGTRIVQSAIFGFGAETAPGKTIDSNPGWFPGRPTGTC